MRRFSRSSATGPSGRRWSVARQLLVMQVAMVSVLVLGGAGLAYVDAANTVRDQATEEVVSVAVTLADSPDVRQAVSLADSADSADPSGVLQPFAEQVRADTGVDFITIMDRDRTRFTHPDPRRIGEPFIGTIGPALHGQLFTETYTGTLGPSVRAVAPVFTDGEVTAMVAAGITVEAISGELAERLPPVLAVAAGVLLVGIVGSVAVSDRLRRQTRGVAPEELSRMFDYYEAILHSVREGLLLVGHDGRVVLCNDAAAELLGLSDDVRGLPVAGLGLADDLARTMVSERAAEDELHVTDTRVLLVNTVPVRSRDRAMGNVVTLRDHTELQSLTGELDTVRGFAESLRAQAHESANRLHAVVSLVELGRTEQAVSLATAELRAAQELTDRVLGAVGEPVLAALLLGKSSEAAERGVELVLTGDTALEDTSALLDSRDLITVLGNLVDNAVDAAVDTAAERAPTVTVTVRRDGAALLLRVADSGPGVDPAVSSDIFRRGWSTKPGGGEAGRGLGLALVGQTVRRLGGTLTTTNAEAGGAVFTIQLPVPAGHDTRADGGGSR
ncbi:ATP-binding protein [Saccharomonospora piscinae]|uniref:ATP-binding protein n=1 Tax=Saccharomonospora piscinae TaxID=687388 RepID=UPI0004650F97|nr:sensor histidine kinase [Saccharomonospora piscinae]